MKAKDGVSQSAVRKFEKPALAASSPTEALPPEAHFSEREVLEETPSATTAAPPSSVIEMSASRSAREEALDRQCLELEGTISDLRQQIGELEQSAHEREISAFEKGKAEAIDLATGDSERRMELFKESLTRMEHAQSDKLAELELLALQIARTALSRIFGDDTSNVDRVTATIGHHLAQVQTEFVTRVRVSPEDFQDDKEIASLSDRFRKTVIELDPGLASGECVADLKLGQIDLGIDGQWQRLNEFLDSLANGETSA